MMPFKNVGTFEVRITEKERKNGMYSTPELSVGDKILIKKSTPEGKVRFRGVTASIWSEMRTYVIDQNTRSENGVTSLSGLYQKLNGPLAKEQYVVVRVLEYRFADPGARTTHRETVYHLVKKRNYNKYIVQSLADNHRIDYVIARRQQELDKALNLGFIEKI